LQLYPSIDVREGKVVRLARGDYSVQTTYGDDPVAVARGFEAAGAQWIHVVDLDAALDGGDGNLGAIEAICAGVDVRVQTGGGVRSVTDASNRFAAGATRVVVGSAAVDHPEIVDELAISHPGRVAVGLDARGRDVAIHGWTNATGVDLLDLVRKFDHSGVGALIVTEISRDGMLSGPALDTMELVLGATGRPVIASGGVSSVDDLRALARLPLEGAIVGRAIYEHRFTVEEGIAACSAPV
jgi:phosphoribosylformimino-5-aminoimidazole carboxamide ribotide isomerase